MKREFGFLLYTMSQWCWKENRRTEAWLEPWHWEEKDEGPGEDEEIFQRLTLRELLEGWSSKERNSWLTPTESCESDETEVEVVKSFRAPPALPDPLVEEARVREPMIQTHEGHKAVCGDRQREEQRRAE